MNRAERMAQASQRTREESISVNAEFAEIERGDMQKIELHIPNFESIHASAKKCHFDFCTALASWHAISPVLPDIRGRLRSPRNIYVCEGHKDPLRVRLTVPSVNENPDMGHQEWVLI